MTWLMPCAYSEINRFENELVIEAHELTNYHSGKDICSKMTGRVSVSFYSLNKCQKWAGFTVSALAIITLLVGFSSLTGANFIGTKAAFAMIGMGGGVFVIIAGTMSVNHLLLVKRAGSHLSASGLKFWENAAIYPCNVTWKGQNNSKNNEETGWFHQKGNTWLGRRYGVYDGGLKFYIEFYRTPSVFIEK